MCELFVLDKNSWYHITGQIASIKNSWYQITDKQTVSEESHHLEEVRRIATVVGQKNPGTWTKGESANDRAVTWRDLKYMEPKKLSFRIKVVYDVLRTPVNLHAWGLITSDRCKARGKTARLKHILPGCAYALRSYTWRHNEVLQIFPVASKICFETANKTVNNITNRVIHCVKEGNISKLSRKNKHSSSLLDGCTDWHVATDLRSAFNKFPDFFV